MPAAINSDSLFLELGKALYVFQAIEARIKFVLPHLSLPDTGEPPADEGWTGRNKYLESKEMLGNLIKFLQQRVSVDDPEHLEAEFRALVLGRNEVVHQFVLQPFARCESAEELERSIEFVRSRRTRALPLLAILDHLLSAFATALALPSDFQGEFTIQMPEWGSEGAARPFDRAMEQT